MVFLANLGVNLHVCLCGDLQVASAQTLDFLDIGQKSSFPDWKRGSTGKSFPDGNCLICLKLVKPGLATKRWDWAPAGCEEKFSFPDWEPDRAG
ncbi:hypothetical protein TRIP_B10060 [uncultured Desulfatiglans sp.]|uniref:Uncharacterized protein n=1 Tax=Uncultured Desulfatiglans sp. TaxID=1748965 RepID=A0A653A115_UNCDX|nr:hypothetical protein TRIP_B10060 [uncultured Desulfatiglans sp.]